jgi:Fe-Mn family superoxide dismutase
MKRKQFLLSLGVLPFVPTMAKVNLLSNKKNNRRDTMSKFELPKLPFDFNALEPHIDARTMEIHHGKHHAGYVSKLNTAIEGTDLEGKSLEDLMKTVSSHSLAVRNNGGGHFNHSLFWTVMGPNKGGTPSGDLADAINSTFGSFDKFKDEFSNAAATRFGSGWAWLVVSNGKLVVSSTQIKIIR